jgi:MFS family permease
MVGLEGDVYNSTSVVPGDPVPDAQLSGYNSRKSTAAMLAVILAAGASVATLPGVIGAFVAAHRATLGQAAFLGAVEPAGTTVAMLAAATLPVTINRRTVALVAIIIIAIAQLLSAWVQPIPYLMATRFALGCAEGVLFTMVTATIAATLHPERLFGINFALNLVIASAFYAVAPVLSPGGQLTPVMSVLSFLALAAGLALPWFPKRPPKVASQIGAEGSERLVGVRAKREAGLVLGGSFLLYVGIGAVWPLVALIGRQHNLTTTTVSAALSTASIAGIAGGFLASWIGIRFGRALPMSIGTAGIGLAMTLLLIMGSTLAFTAAVLLFMGCWIFIGPFYLGTISSLDSSGRLTAVTLAVQMFGLTAGQGMVAVFFPAGAFTPAILCAIILAVLAIGITGTTVGLRRS